MGLLGSTGLGSYGIYLESASTQLEASDYNDIWVSPTGSGVAAIGKVATNDYTTLSAWQTATSQDANSISGDPKYVSDTELHIMSGVTSPVVETGVFLDGIVDNDIDGDVRLDPPDMGADAVSLFNQPYYDGGSSYTSTIDSDYPIDLEVADNFSGIQDPIVKINFYGMALSYDGQWTEQTPNPQEPFIVRFYEYEILDGGTYEICLEDSDGDGWQTYSTPAYHTVSVLVNGTAVLSDIYLATGSGPDCTNFTVGAGDIITTVFTNNGDYADECSYTINGPASELIAVDGRGTDIPVGLYLAAKEPDWDNPESSQEITADVSAVGTVWNVGYTIYRFQIELNDFVEMDEGWVSAQIDANHGSGVWFLWMNSQVGDGQSYQKNRK